MVPSAARRLLRRVRQRHARQGRRTDRRFGPVFAVVGVAVLAVVATTLASGLAVGTATGDVATHGEHARLDGSGPSPVLVTVDGGPNYLDLGGSTVSRSATGEVGLDVGTAVSTGANRLRGSFASRSAERALSGVRNETRREAIVRNRTGHLERRRAAIERANRRTIQGFSNGTISARAFLHRRAAIAAAAVNTQRAATRLKNAGNAPVGYDLPRSLEVRLDAVRSIGLYQGSVSNWTQRAAVGDVPWSQVYAEVSAEGYTTALVSGNDFRRETYVGSEYVPGGSDQFATSDEPRISAAISRWSELYPFVASQPQSHVAFGSTGIYRHTATLVDGELTVYLDGSTRNPFRESRSRQENAILRRETVRSSGGPLALTLNRTYETGPARLHVRDENGSRINATVVVENQFVTPTGGDGRLTFVEPRRPYTINATTADGRQTVLTVTDG